MIYGYARCSTEPENIKFSGSFVLLLQQSHLQSSRGLCNIVLAKNRNFDRNPLRGCNYGLEGGAFLILGGATTALGGALLYPWGQQ